MRPRDPAMISKQRTDCRADIGTDARVWDESLLFPRHTPPRAGPRLYKVFVVVQTGLLTLVSSLLSGLYESRVSRVEDRLLKPYDLDV